MIQVITIIGILSAIAIPSFLSQANRARESEARAYVGSINRSQQTRRIEEGEFGTLVELGSPIPTITANYQYEVTVQNDDTAIVTATPVIAALPPVSGIVAVETVGTTGEATFQVALCPGTLTPTIGCEQ